MKPLKLQTSYHVAFSPDGSLLATDDARYVNIWHLTARKKMLRFRPFAWAGNPSFSPDGTRLAVKNSSGRIGVVDVVSGDTLADFENETAGKGSNVSWSPDGRFLVDGSWNGRVMVRKWESGECVFSRDFPHELISRIHTSVDGKTWVVMHTPKWHEGLSPNQPLPPVYFGVWKWPFADNPERTLPARLTGVVTSTLSPAGTYIAVIHDGGLTRPEIGEKRLTVMSVSDGSILRSESISEGIALSELAWSPNERLLAAAYRECRVDPDAPPRVPDAPPWDHSGFKFESMVIFWDTSDLREVRRIEMAYPGGVAFSPLGTSVAIAAAPGVVIAADF